MLVFHVLSQLVLSLSLPPQGETRVCCPLSVLFLPLKTQESKWWATTLSSEVNLPPHNYFSALFFSEVGHVPPTDLGGNETRVVYRVLFCPRKRTYSAPEHGYPTNPYQDPKRSLQSITSVIGPIMFRADNLSARALEKHSQARKGQQGL